MSTMTRSSAQRSRPTSPYDDDVVEAQEETPSSDHEEEPEVSFHPLSITATASTSSRSTTPSGRHVYALY